MCAFLMALAVEARAVPAPAPPGISRVLSLGALCYFKLFELPSINATNMLDAACCRGHELVARALLQRECRRCVLQFDDATV